MKIKLLLLTLIASALLGLMARAAGGKPTVYVTDFCTRDREINNLTMKLTSDFEVALSNTGKYEILERRDFDQLRAQAKNEAGIVEMSGMPGALVNALKTKSAEMVIFGEVFDDIDSGQISVTVSFVAFSGEKKLMLNGKIPRGKRDDADSRTAAMDELVKKIVTSARKVFQTEMNGVLFQVVSCRASDRVLTVDLTITNNEDDKQMWMAAGDNTLVFDNKGNRTNASTARLANLVGREPHLDLIAGVPVKGSLEFQGVSPSADAIARVDIFCWESLRQRWFTVSFRNLPIER